MEIEEVGLVHVRFQYYEAEKKNIQKKKSMHATILVALFGYSAL